MQTEQRQLVQASFAKVLPIAAQAADLFYSRLFELDPSLRPLFKPDMKEQKQKLMQMLAAAVRGLTTSIHSSPSRDLGARHLDMGSGTNTMTRLRQRCCGRSSRVSDRTSQARPETHGLRYIRCSPRP